MLVTKSNEDLKTALKILDNHGKCNNKQECIIAELKIRNMPECASSKSRYAKSFSDEWNKVTQKFRDASKRRAYQRRIQEGRGKND